MSVRAEQAANTIGKAPTTSAIACRLHSLHSCALKRFFFCLCCRSRRRRVCAARAWICVDVGVVVMSRLAPLRGRSAKAASGRRAPARGMAKLKRSQVSPPGPNCGPGLAKMRARLATRSANLVLRPVPAKSTQPR